MATRKFSPGFRLSTLDVFVLITGAAGAAALASIHFWPGIVIAFVVLHFFIFCNIVRMSRGLELIWAGCFVTLTILAMTEIIPWMAAFAIAAAITPILVIIEARRPWYHGVAWKRLNPKLPEWWEKQNASSDQ